MGYKEALLLILVGLILNGFFLFQTLDVPLNGFFQENKEDTPGGAPGEVHLHAYMFFLVEGEEMSLDRRYYLRSPEVHFHRDDNIIHVEAPAIDINRTLSTLEMEVNSSCLEFEIEGERYCGGGNEVRVNINGREVPVEEALSREIQQDDNIVVYFGKPGEDIPDTYTDRRLPEEYRPGSPGTEI